VVLEILTLVREASPTSQRGSLANHYQKGMVHLGTCCSVRVFGVLAPFGNIRPRVNNEVMAPRALQTPSVSFVRVLID
jgi:hypothetical protein